MHLWDRLIPQSVLTLNLLRPSRQNPSISAYTALRGEFNYDATPLAPPGCKIIAFESPQIRRTFAPHGVPAWYNGPALEHYRCYKVYVPKTRAERISDTVSFHPHLCETPVLQPIEQAVIAADKLSQIIQTFYNNNKVQHHETDNTAQALLQLSKIFQRRMKKFKDSAKSPRVMQQKPPPNANSHFQTNHNVSDSEM